VIDILYAVIDPRAWWRARARSARRSSAASSGPRFHGKLREATLHRMEGGARCRRRIAQHRDFRNGSKDEIATTIARCAGAPSR
jgi:hypothetical protein